MGGRCASDMPLLAAEMSSRGYSEHTPVRMRSAQGHWPAVFIGSPSQQFTILADKYRDKESGRIPPASLDPDALVTAPTLGAGPRPGCLPCAGSTGERPASPAGVRGVGAGTRALVAQAVDLGWFGPGAPVRAEVSVPRPRKVACRGGTAQTDVARRAGPTRPVLRCPGCPDRTCCLQGRQGVGASPASVRLPAPGCPPELLPLPAEYRGDACVARFSHAAIHRQYNFPVSKQGSRRSGRADQAGVV